MKVRPLLRWWMLVCALVGVVFFASQLAEIPHRSALRGYDNTFNYLWLRSAVEDGDWDFRNDLAACNTLVPEQRASALALPPTKAVRIPNKYGIGWAALSVPFYLIAEMIVAVGDITGAWTSRGDGFGPVHQVALQTGHALLAILALWLAVRVVARWVGDRAAAVGGVLAVWVASPLLYYQTVNLSMSHGAAFFAVTLMAYAIERATTVTGRSRAVAREAPATDAGGGQQAPLRGAENGNVDSDDHAWRWWWLAGAAFGLAVVTRFQLVVFGLPLAWAATKAVFERSRVPELRGSTPHVPAAHAAGHLPRCEPGERNTVDLPAPSAHAVGDTAARDRQAANRRFSPAVLILLGAAPFLLLQFWAWRSVYGEWLVFSYGVEGEGFAWTRPALLGSLASPHHGLFYWHPFLAVALSGMLMWVWRHRGASLSWGAAWAATVYVNAAWWCWWFASSFGNRGHDAALLPLMAGAGWLFARARPTARRLLAVVAIAAAGWNVYLVLLYRSGAISRQAPVTWGEMFEAAKQLPNALQF